MSPNAISAIITEECVLYSTQSFKIYDVRQPATSTYNLADEILKGLTPDSSCMKSIPTIVLYNDRGLQLFDEITYLEEYYLTNAEIDILTRKVDQIVEYVKNGSVIIELGAGSLRKTRLILNALARNKKEVTYYALDLIEDELKKSLSSLREISNVTLIGLLGTYEEGMKFVSKLTPETPKTIMWLGSSIGNFNREDAATFINNFRLRAMEVGDLFLIGIDRRNDPQKVALAYNDRKGITSEFIMNGLDHVNIILGGQPFINRNNFKYLAKYNCEEGRHEAYYQAKIEHTLEYISPETEKKTSIHLKEGERIHIEYSYKYDAFETAKLIHDSHLQFIESWPDSLSQYDLHIVQKSPFHFNRIKLKSRPSVDEWKELWKSWDTVTITMITPKMHNEKPIALRHPFIFYLGHIPAFLDINLAKYFNERFTDPQNFADIFERGIDPDIDNPSQCHPHSIVPNEWPSLESILEFRDLVRQRLLKVYESHGENMTRRLGRVLWMTFEHEAMHLETILYMLIQSPNTVPPKGIIPPKWHIAKREAEEASLIDIPSQTVILGHDDNEEMDDTDPLTLAFGWDNERPSRKLDVQGFKIQSRPVTNKEYLTFLETTQANNEYYPASWIPSVYHSSISSQSIAYNVRTVFGSVDISVAKNWPVMLSHEQASKYAEWKGMRLPTEAELQSFYKLFTHATDLSSNTGFLHWHPIDVPLDAKEVHTIGSGWEWTDTQFDEHVGFKKSELYPGYSSDFFDTKHAVILGGSWATHPRISTRRTFRNWYQRGYPFVFCAVRFCEIENR
ncbi:hypothetical protein G9A89_013718 [Geosiphon pyriformis]|nr:hypothetical protein G9A89_013718 [Geosiphon pyriformis]